MRVKTSIGIIKGKIEEGIAVFRGIPYSEKIKRFQHSEVIKTYQTEIDATSYGNRAMQEDINILPPVSEDCLTLNIWTKDVTTKKPVVVWVHGGGFVGGSNSELQYKGNGFAEDDLVFVNVNYRLGALGFLQVDEYLGEEYINSGNCGVSDVVTALKWVQQHIAQFGGDSNQVTVMGESAGAKMTATLLVVPEAKGLFHRMVLQSGALQSIRSKETAQTIAKEIIQELDLQQSETILTISATRIIEAQKKAMEKYICGLHVFGPVIDGEMILDTRTFCSQVPLLLGFNKQESLCFLNGDVVKREKIVLDHLFAENSQFVWDTYKDATKEMDEEKAWEEVLTHYFYAMASERLANEMQENVWFYRFDYEGQDGPAHAEDLPYVFNHHDYHEGKHELSEEAQQVAHTMNGYWKKFIKEGFLPWSCYDASTKKGMTFNVTSKEEDIKLVFHKDFPRECFKKGEKVWSTVS